MSTTANTHSTLYQLRALVPPRALTYNEALRIAELQANRFLQAAGVTEPGTPSEIVTGLPFVRVVVRRSMPVSGSAQWYKPRWLILLNGTEPVARRRFSLMHEFKHILDHPWRDRDGVTPEQHDHAEHIADYFAACVLMPKRLVKRLYFSGTQDPTELAEMFGVSPIAMRYRIDQLGLRAAYQRCARPHTARQRYHRPRSSAPLSLG